MSGHIERHLLQVRLGQALANIQHLEADHAILAVKVDDYAGADFLGFDNVRVVQADVERVRLGVELESHGLVSLVR